MQEALRTYLEERIIPRYDAFDRGHQRGHVLWVIRESLRLGALYHLDLDCCQVIAAYHDLGLEVDRQTHHLESARILLEDAFLRSYFSEEQLEMMAQAIRDHRASSKTEPQSIYGKVVADADRQIETDSILRRAIQYGLAHYPELSGEEQILRARLHLQEKYQEGGYLHLYLEDETLMERFRVLRQLLRDESRVNEMLRKILREEQAG